MTTITTKTRVRIGKDPVPPQPMTVEEYARFEEPEDGYRYELVRGMLMVQEPGPGYPHGFLQADLAWHLGNWAHQTGCGNVAVAMDCIIGMTPATVRRPDISVFIEPGDWENTPGNWAKGAPRNSDRSTLAIEHAGNNARKDARLLRGRSAARLDGGPQDPHRDHTPGGRLGDDLPGWRAPRRPGRTAGICVGGEGVV